MKDLVYVLAAILLTAPVIVVLLVLTVRIFKK
jgi:hypothetical protein